MHVYMPFFTLNGGVHGIALHVSMATLQKVMCNGQCWVLQV